MRPHDLEALEYPRLLARLAEFVQSPAGAAACRALRPGDRPARGGPVAGAKLVGVPASRDAGIAAGSGGVTVVELRS